MPAPAPTHIASSSVTNTVSASANITCSYPAGSLESDLPGIPVYLLFHARFIRLVDGEYTIATPAGWDLLEVQNPTSSGVDSNASAVFGKFRGAENSVTAVASTSDQMFGTGAIKAYRGVNLSAPVNAKASAYTNASGTALSIPTITTTIDNCTLALFASGYRSGSTSAYTHAWTAPPVEQQDVTAAQTAAVARIGLTDATDIQAVAGATGAKTCTASVANLGRFRANIALAPVNSNFLALM